VSRKTFYFVMIFGFTLILVSLFLRKYQQLSNIFWIGGTVISYGIWSYDLYQRDMPKKEEFIYDGFLVCSVRDPKSGEREEQEAWVAYAKEELGLRLYWPYEDTNQNDPIGGRICADNREAIKASRKVYIWWNPASYGSHYDLGVALALGKHIVPLNLDRFEWTMDKNGQKTKSFTNILKKLSEELDNQEV